MPDHSEMHAVGTTTETTLDHDEAGEFNSISIEIPVTCASANAAVHSPECWALPETTLQMEYDLQFVLFENPHHKANAPPGFSIYHFFRGPPA
jgi:hypothetical protein